MGNDRRRALGQRGEELAAAHLVDAGFSTLARNVRTRCGEIDLIAFDGHTLVFAEVKSRLIGAGQHHIRPEQEPLIGLSARQRARVRRAASAWLRDERPNRPVASTIRFDAIGVLIDTRGGLRRLEHVEGAW
jgi:putative endonuclease